MSRAEKKKASLDPWMFCGGAPENSDMVHSSVTVVSGQLDELTVSVVTLD